MAKESRNKYLFKNTAIFAIGNMGTRFINFIIVPLYTYALTTAEYGTVNTIISVCSILIPLIMCNINESIRRYLLDRDANVYSIQTVEIVWFGFGAAISVIMFGVLHFFPSFRDYAAEMSLYVLGNTFLLTALDYLRGKEKLKLYMLCSLLQTFMVAALNILFLVYLHQGIHGYFRSYVISYFACGILAFVSGGQIKNLRYLYFDKELFVEMSKFSITLVPNSIMWWITNASDKLMITYLISSAANGIYSIASKLPTVLSTLNTIMLQAWQYSAIKESDSQDKVEYNNHMMQLYMVTTSLAGAFLLLINRPFMYIYVAPEYRGAWVYSPFLILSSMFETLNTFVGTSYYVEKDMKGNLKSATVGAVVNILLNLILIPTIGVTGAAIATCLSYAMVLIYRINDTYKYLPLTVKTSLSKKLLIAMLYMLICSYVRGWGGYICLGVGMIAVLWITKNYYIDIVLCLYNTIKKRKGYSDGK